MLLVRLRLGSPRDPWGSIGLFYFRIVFRRRRSRVFGDRSDL